jgi:hypothetical protein
MRTPWILFAWAAVFVVASGLLFALWDESVTYSAAGRELPDWLVLVAAPLIASTIVTGAVVGLVTLVTGLRLRRVPDGTSSATVMVWLAIVATTALLFGSPSISIGIP